MSKVMVLPPHKMLLGGVAAIALLTAGLTLGMSQALGRNLLKAPQFSCQSVVDPLIAELFWTVSYHGREQPQPLLRMIPGMEGDAILKARCEQVASQLGALGSTQLKALSYEPNPATPDRHAICVYTEENPKNCKTLLILKPDTDPIQFFADFVTPLRDSGELMQLETTNQVPLDLQPFLAS